MTTYCLDTSAWLEYFNAGPHGPTVRRLLSGNDEVITPTIVVAQLIEAARRRRENSKNFLQFLQSRSRLAPLTAEVARQAGKINATRSAPGNDWTLVESIIVATARDAHARLVTSDPIFADSPQADLLGRVSGAV